MLASNLVTPEVTNTTVLSNLLKALNVIAACTNQNVDNALRSFARGEVLLSVHKPVRNLELLGVVDDCDVFLNLFVSEGTSTTSGVDFCLLADHVGKASANTSDLGHRKHHLSLTLNVGVQHTKNVLELIGHLETLQIKTIITN